MEKGMKMSKYKGLIVVVQAQITDPMMDCHSRHEKAFVDFAGSNGDHRTPFQTKKTAGYLSGYRIKINPDTGGNR